MAKQTKEDKIANRVYEIYGELKPSLLALAYRYKAPNPQDLVDSWMSRAYEIVDRFDKGELKGKVYVDPDKQGEMEDYIPSVHEQDRFIKSLKNYLKQSFLNDILRVYYKNKKTKDYQDDLVEASSPAYASVSFDNSALSLLEEDIVTLEKFTKVVEKDYIKVKAENCSMADLVQEKFLLAFYNFCNSLMRRGEEWKKMIIVNDIDEKENKKYFCYDFRTEIEEGTKRELCRLILQEENPILLKKLHLLASESNKFALQKRIFRYLYEYNGGMPVRLKLKLKNQEI